MKRSLAFDAARALAALHIVCLHHLKDYSRFLGARIGGPLNTALVIGELAFFFFCSAYLVARKTDVRSAADAVRFWRRRCVRLLPLFLVALMLLPYAVPFRLRLLSVVGANNFLPGIADHNVPTLWFVSVIVLFYFLFPGLRAILGAPARAVVCVAVEAALHAGAHRWGWDPRLWWYFPSYAAGILAIGLDERALFRISLFLAAGFAGILLFAPFRPSEIPVATAFCGAGVLFTAASGVARIRPLGPLLSFVAYASMAMYLFHRPVYHFARDLGLPPDGPARLAVLFGVCVPVVILVGWLVQRGYDRLVALLQGGRTAAAR